MKIRALILGTVLAIASLALLVFAAWLGLSFLIPAIVFFGFPAVYIFNLIAPSSLIYSLFPEGGGGAFIGLSFLGATIQLIAIFTFVIYRFKYAKQAGGKN